MAAFDGTLKAFCGELRLTFPELEASIARAATLTAAQFWNSWSGNLEVLLNRTTEGLFTARSGFLIGPVRLTPALWSELSPTTQAAVWRYLRTLSLEAALVVGIDGLNTEASATLMAILTAEKLEKGGAEAAAETSEMFEESMKHLSPLLERLKSMMGSAGGFMDLSGFTMPEIPERLRNGRIAKLAEEMAKQFDPAEFGLDPTVLKGDNVEEILKRLADIYQRDPTLLIGGAKKVAERIKKQILGGSLNRDELVAEAQEFITLFKEHPQFKEMIGKFTDFMGPGGIAEMFSGTSSNAEPSERRRAVQERLRRKLAARNASAKK